VLAEVFRCDADNMSTISASDDALPFTEIVRLIRIARKEFGLFEMERCYLTHLIEVMY